MTERDKSLSKAVGKIFAEKRRELGYSQAKVAAQLRIQRTSLSNIESGKQVILLDIFCSLCGILDLSPSEVLDRAAHFEEPLAEVDRIVNNISN